MPPLAVTSHGRCTPSKVDRVAVLGCGGLGSWLAEFVARALPASIALYDYAAVTGGLLVRQNYTDADISHSKAEALKSRTLAISPGMDVAVNVSGGLDEHLLDLLRSEGGVVIDLTVNRAVAQVLRRSQSIRGWACCTPRSPRMSQPGRWGWSRWPRRGSPQALSHSTRRRACM